MSQILKMAACYLIRIYKMVLSPLLGPSCRFSPSCSSYALSCIERFGFFKGTLLSVKRLLKCHPWGSYGFSPPPVDIQRKEIK